MQATPALVNKVQCQECFALVDPDDLHWYADCIIEKVRSLVHGMDDNAVGRVTAQEIIDHINYMRGDGNPPHPKDIERNGRPARREESSMAETSLEYERRLRFLGWSRLAALLSAVRQRNPDLAEAFEQQWSEDNST